MLARKKLCSLASLASIICTASFINPPARAQVVTVRGNKYDISVYRGAFDDLVPVIGELPWFGSRERAREFANAYGTARAGVFFPYEAGSSGNIVESIWSRDDNIFTNFKDQVSRYAVANLRVFDGISPNNNGSVNITSNLDISIKPIFKGGTLKVDQSYRFPNFIFPQNFTLDQDGTIDANDTAHFTGAFTGAGTLTIANSGDLSAPKITLGSSSNRILLGGLATAPSNSTGGYS